MSTIDEDVPVDQPRFRTVEEYEARQTSIREELTSLDAEWAGRVMPEEQTRRWNSLNEELEDNQGIITHISARSERLAQLSRNPTALENGSNFNTPRAASSDIYDVWAVRQMARGPEDEARLLRDNASRAIERADFPHPDADTDTTRAHIEKLMKRFAAMDESATFGQDTNLANFARQILVTGNPTYTRAFGKTAMGRALSPEETRALAAGTTTAGGFAVPFTLDPTIIPTGNSSVNPYRTIARVETIGTTFWKGVAADDITATYRAEGAQVADNAPTLAQPSGQPERCDVFIPYSIEVGQDWGSLQTEMARLIQRAKDNVEADKFTNGVGHGSNEPWGITSGATTVVTGATSATFAIADVYSVYNNLPPGFKPNAQWVANEATYNLTRQFDTAGGAGLWIQNLQLGTGGTQVPTPGGISAKLLNRPAWECSSFATGTATGALLMVIGDWYYFVIVDRIGMNVEFIPHLFGTTQRPTGQRGMFAIWRNTSVVVSPNAFRVLKVK